jgi:hypothetical protein
MAQPQRLADAHAAVEQHREQQPVPQMVAGVQDRLHLPGGQHPRLPLGRRQLHRPAPLRLVLGEVVQQRPPGATLPPARAQADQQLTPLDPVAGVELVEARQRRQLPVDAGLAAVALDRRQHQHPPAAGLGRRPQPGQEAAQVLELDPAPVQVTLLQEAEPVLEVVGIPLDGVGRALDHGQVGKPALDRLHRRVVVAQHRPGLCARVGHPHSLYTHAASRFSVVDDGR